jgi:aminoglycoside 6'-N-acetyltransferase I
MTVKTILSTINDAYIVKNMYPLYLHDLCQFSGEKPNQHGILEPTAVSTLTEQGEVQSIWWKKPDVLYPFIIQVDAKPAGFAFVARPPHVPESVDFLLHEFFIVRSFRNAGVGKRAAREVFDRFRGRWQFEVLAKNLGAQEFWRKVLREYTAGTFQERSVSAGNGLGPSFQFQNLTRDG